MRRTRDNCAGGVFDRAGAFAGNGCEADAL